MDIKATELMETVSLSLGTEFTLDPDKVDTIQGILFNMAKLMVADKTTILLDILSELEIDASPKAMQQIVGTKLGKN